VTVMDALGNISTTVYNTIGQTTVSIDALSRRTTSTYDNNGRQIQKMVCLIMPPKRYRSDTSSPPSALSPKRNTSSVARVTCVGANGNGVRLFMRW
jgi:YD repeat-containing protein